MSTDKTWLIIINTHRIIYKNVMKINIEKPWGGGPRRNHLHINSNLGKSKYI